MKKADSGIDLPVTLNGNQQDPLLPHDAETIPLRQMSDRSPSF